MEHKEITKLTTDIIPQKQRKCYKVLNMWILICSKFVKAEKLQFFSYETKKIGSYI